MVEKFQTQMDRNYSRILHLVYTTVRTTSTKFRMLPRMKYTMIFLVLMINIVSSDERRPHPRFRRDISLCVKANNDYTQLKKKIDNLQFISKCKNLKNVIYKNIVSFFLFFFWCCYLLLILKDPFERLSVMDIVIKHVPLFVVNIVKSCVVFMTNS